MTRSGITCEKDFFLEIFHETSSGDFGLQIANGPLFRCHTSILQSLGGGFLSRIRNLAKELPAQMPPNYTNIPHDKYVKNHANIKQHVLKDMEFIRFSRYDSTNCMGSVANGARIFGPGASTATDLGGSLGAVKRRDPFMLSERYEVSEGYEQIVELLRYIYKGELFYLLPGAMPLTKSSERKEKTRKIRDMLLIAGRYSVDSCFAACLRWFDFTCLKECGEGPFADVFFHLEHYSYKLEEPLFFRKLRDSLIKMLSDRKQFRLITRDSRWSTLDVKLTNEILDSDSLAVANEGEVQGLVERWNAHADKSKDDINRLMRCVRTESGGEDVGAEVLKKKKKTPWPELIPLGKEAIVKNLEPFSPRIAGGHGFVHLPKGLDETRVRKPRKNTFSGDIVKEEERIAAEEAAAAAKKDAEVENADEQTFVLVDSDNLALDSGFTFPIGRGQSVLQKTSLVQPGSYRIRVSAKQVRGFNDWIGRERRKVPLQSLNPEWSPSHHLFIGVNFGPSKYFGYLLSLSEYAGIFKVAQLSSALPEPLEPNHITGSSNRIEIDCELRIEMARVNRVVPCSLSVIMNSTAVVTDMFEIAEHTLTDGPGLRSVEPREGYSAMYNCY